MPVTLRNTREERAYITGLPVRRPALHEVARAERKRAGLKLVEAAELSNYEPGSVSRLENGHRPFTQDSIAVFARALNSLLLLECYCDNCPVSKAYREIEERKCGFRRK